MDAIATLNAFAALHAKHLAEVKATHSSMEAGRRLMAKHPEARGIHEAMREEARHRAIEQMEAAARGIDVELSHFRALAAAMINPAGAAEDWQWEGVHMSQRMYGITEARATDYAKRFGGVASRMAR